MGYGYNFRETEASPAPKGVKSMGPKVLDELRVKKGTAGGHVVKHSFEYNKGPGPSHPDETFPFGEGQGPAVLAHIAKHLGIKGAAAAPPAPAGGNSLAQ